MDPKSPVNWKAAIDELTKGRDLAVRLGTKLGEVLPAGHEKKELLLAGISDSFSRALMALSSGVIKLESDRIEEKNGKTFGEKRKSRSGRGGYRQRAQPYSCTRTAAKTLKDGHSWRKYGQKAILDSKFPRCYYRCSHKHDQKCAATKQVQQSEQDPSLYIITYFGEHTCQDFNEASTSLENNEPCIIDFGTSNNYAATPTSQDHKSPSLPISGTDDVVSNGCLVEGSAQLVEELMSDVTSCSPDSVVDSLGWDFVESFEFSDILDLDQGGGFF
nr:WRKY transcription factor 16 [Crocus sativus]